MSEDRKEPLILFEEEGWIIDQPPNFFIPGLVDGPRICHKHKNWRGKEKSHPANYFDIGTWYSFGGRRPPAKEWDYQCSKCGEDTPSEIKTRFCLLSD